MGLMICFVLGLIGMNLGVGAEVMIRNDVVAPDSIWGTLWVCLFWPYYIFKYKKKGSL